MVDLLVRAFAADYNDRAFDGGSPTPGELFRGVDVPIPARYVADPDGNPHPRMSPVPFHEDDRVRVRATLVQHAPMFPALAYRFDTDDGSAVFSGDTGPSENLVELAHGADVLVHEAIDTGWADELLPLPRTAAQEALFQHLVGAHSAVEQAAAVARAAGVGTLVLSPLIPGNRPRERWQCTRGAFAGRFLIGEDLMVVDVAAARL
jgi:ribonuclease BN (tRNA processing enzyme)